MKTKEDILMMLQYLDNERSKAVANGIYSMALALASQIELLKWVLDAK